MASRVVAQRLTLPVYLIAIDGGMGRVLDVRQKTLSSPLPLQSIYARGYWNAVAADTPSLEQLLAAANVRLEGE